jgi:hypothetical protein
MTMATYRYWVDGFEIETIEPLRETYDGEMTEARLTSGWDLRIPQDVTVTKIPEPLPALDEGFYAMAGIPGILQRTRDIDGSVLWYSWSGEGWVRVQVNENDQDVRDNLTFLD